MPKLRVRFLATVFEGGVRYPLGSVAKLEEERVRSLGGIVEILDKDVKSPPKNKKVEKTESK